MSIQHVSYNHNPNELANLQDFFHDTRADLWLKPSDPYLVRKVWQDIKIIEHGGSQKYACRLFETLTDAVDIKNNCQHYDHPVTNSGVTQFIKKFSFTQII